MGFGGDSRAQATQIGFVLTLGILVVAFSMYQSTIIPNQNGGAEFTHNQRVQKQMLDLRNNILGVSSTSSAKGSVLEMAPDYQTRLIGLNPREPAGRLYTIGTGKNGPEMIVEFSGAGRTDNLARPGTYETGSIVYNPTYHEYPKAPKTVYGHTMVYNKHRDGISRLTGQTFIDGTEIKIRHFKSRLNRVTTRTAAVDIKYERGDRYSITQIDGEELQLVFDSYAPPDTWQFLEDSAENVPDEGVSGSEKDPDTDADIYRIEVELDDDEEYNVEIYEFTIQSRIP
jgi:hypothetical protein